MKAKVLMAVVPMLALAACTYDPVATDVADNLEARPRMIVSGSTIFMRSPYSDAVLKITPGEQTGTPEEDAYTELEQSSVEYIGIGENPGDLVLTSDGRYFLSLVHQGDSTGLAVLSPSAKCSGEWPVDASCVRILESHPLHDTLTLSPDGRFALSSISEDAAFTATEDIINLNEVALYDLEDLSVRFVTVGYNPKAVAFTHAETNRRAVVLTETKVVLLDLETGEVTSRELSISSDTQFHPTGVVITGDDHFALVTIQGSGDLFTFDLTQASLPINILDLGGSPTSMMLSATGSEVLVLYTNLHQLGLIHQEDLSVDIFTLDSPVNDVFSPEGTRYAIAYNNSGNGRELYYIDLDTERVDTYLLDNTCIHAEASPGGDALVLYYVMGSYSNSGELEAGYAVAILNLTQGDSAPTPILVRSQPVGAVFHLGAEPSLDQVYVAFDGSESGTVGRFNLSSYDSLGIDVAPRPYAIAMLADGRIVTAHESPLGFLSVFPLDQPDLVQFVRGYLTDGLL